MWTLRTVDEGMEGALLAFRMTPGAVKTLGRAVRADFIVDAALVSRVHCRFTASTGGDLEVEDLASTNGTFVNGSRVTRSALKVGDRVGIGRVEFEVGQM